MDEFGQSDLEKVTNDSHKACYPHAVHQKKRKKTLQ